MGGNTETQSLHEPATGLVRVFISSTSVDLAPYREAVKSAVEQIDRSHVVGMETFGARAQRPLEFCIQSVQECDLVLVFVAHCYGSVPPGEQDTEHAKSFTWREAEAAQAAGKDLLVFLVADDYGWPGPREGDRLSGDNAQEVGAKVEALKQFKHWLCNESGAMHARFTTPQDLHAKVASALANWFMGRHGLAGASRTQAGAAPAPPTSTWIRPECPFPGLLPFDRDRADLYAGREEELAELRIELARRLGSKRGQALPWVQIEGASGAGKSSFARAGLVPLFERWNEEGTYGRFRIGVANPGVEPLRNIALAVAQALGIEAERVRRAFEGGAGEHGEDGLRDLLATRPAPEGTTRLVLVLDQLEECFTHAPSAREAPQRAARHAQELERLGRLLAAALAGGAPLVLITTVRRDYLGEMGRLGTLDALTDQAHRRTLRPMDAKGLERAIRRPAAAAGLIWSDPALPARIARDAADAPGGLALMSHTLEALWQRREQHTLSAQEYEGLSGVAGALGHQARSVTEWLRRRSTELPEALRRGLLALVRLDADGRASRKLCPRGEFLAATGLGSERAEWLLTILAGGRVPEWESTAASPPRLLVAGSEHGERDESLVELVHERLLEPWDAAEGEAGAGSRVQLSEDLAVWIHAERDRLLARDRFESHAEQWREAGGHFWSTDWMGPLHQRFASSGSTSPAARKYLAAARTKRRLILATVIGLALAAISVAWLAWQEIQLERFDAEVARQVAVLEDWRAYLRGDPVQESAQARTDSGLERVSLLASLLGEDRRGAVRARHASLAALSSPSAREAFARDKAADFEPRAAELHAALNRDGHLDWLRRPQSRLEWQQRWQDVVRVPWFQGLTPRYDLIPVRPPAAPADGPTAWQFLLLGTGREPARSEDRWVFEPETGVLLAYLRGDEFDMGSPPGFGSEADRMADGGARRTSASSFFVGVTEWTEGHSNRIPAGRDLPAPDPSARPHAEVDWITARALARAVGGRLPTEAEWEFACRAGTKTRWSHGNEESDLKAYAWFAKSSGPRTHDVGTKLPNPWGLHDMHGNVWEFCLDWFTASDPAHRSGPASPVAQAVSNARVMCGGSYAADAVGCETAYRHSRGPWDRRDDVGFRVVLPCSRP